MQVIDVTSDNNIASIIIYNPNNNTKLIIKPIRPEASTKEKPMKEKRNNSSR